MSADSCALSDAADSDQAVETLADFKGESSTTPASTTRSNSHVARILTLTDVRKAVWARIYRQGNQTGHASLWVEHIPSWREFDLLMVKRHRFIAADPRDNRTLGWISCFRPFPHLSFSCEDDNAAMTLDGTRGGEVLELQVFVADDERGKGVGAILVQTILESIETDVRYSTVQASFFPENRSAEALFSKAGFKHVASRTSIGRMQDGSNRGQWRDLIVVAKKLPDWTQADSHGFDLLGSIVSIPLPDFSGNLSESNIDPSRLVKRPRIE